MIEIRILDTETAPPKHLAAIARALLEIAGEPVVAVKYAEPRKAVPAREYADVPDAVKLGIIAPEGEPSAGEPAASEVFGEPSAAAVFGGNAPAASSLAPSGTPAEPNNGAQTVGASTPAGGVDLDKDGLPWNGTIHASTKVKTADGRWKKRRGVDDAVVAQVEADLRGVMAIPAPAPAVGNVTGASVTEVPAPPAAIPNPPAPSTVPPAPDTIPTPPAGAPKITGFAQLLPAVTNAIASGALTEAQVQAALQKAGVAVLPQLAPRPDLIAAVAAELFPGQ